MTDIHIQYKPVARYRCGGPNQFDNEYWQDLTTYDQFEAASKAPREAYAFNIYEAPIGAEDDIYGGARNLSATYFLGGTVIHKDDLTFPLGPPLTGRVSELLEIMQLLDVRRVILTSTGAWHPMEDTDIVIYPL